MQSLKTRGKLTDEDEQFGKFDVIVQANVVAKNDTIIKKNS